MARPTLIIRVHPDLSGSQINAAWHRKVVE